MSLEAATYVNDLITSNPIATDPRSQGDDHLRLIKAALKTTFPNASRAWRMPTTDASLAGNATVVAPDDENNLFVMNATAAARTVSVPTTGLFDGFTFMVVKGDTSANTVTISAAANINGASTYVLRNGYDYAILIYNANTSTWYAISGRLDYVAPSADTAGNWTVSGTDHLSLIRITAAAANRTVTLPNTVAAGFTAWVRKTDATAGTVTLDATSGGNINGATTVVLRYQYEEVKIVFDGTTWSAPVYDGEEPGTAKLWFTDTAPTGWSLLEGQAISRTTYPRLFALFGTLYGAGNGTTTFNLPDLRGRFLRVWDHGAGVDPDAASRTAPAGSTITAGDHVGTLQDDAFEAHTHSYGNNNPLAASSGGSASIYGGGSAATTTSTGGNETRPKNINVGVIMKLG